MGPKDFRLLLPFPYHLLAWGGTARLAGTPRVAPATFGWREPLLLYDRRRAVGLSSSPEESPVISLLR